MKIQNLLAAAVIALESASAHPAISHAHLHKLKLRDVLHKRIEYDTSHVDWTKMDWNAILGKKPAAALSTGTPSANTGSSGSSGSSGPPAPVNTPAPSTKSYSSSSSTGNCLDVSKLSSKRATDQQDSWVGNNVNNIHGESNCQSSKDYSLTFTNKRGSSKTYWLWNKASSSGKTDGMMLTASRIFTLQDGQSATFSFDKGSMVGFSEDCGRATANGGVPNCNVGEASFADGNTGGGSDGSSFADVSLVPITDITATGGSPSKIPMTISASGNDDSSLTQCNYVVRTDNSPVNFPPGKNGCKLGSPAGQPYHPTVTFG